VRIELIDKARNFVKLAHAGQTRYGGMNFVLHPYYVGTYLRLHSIDYGITMPMVIAGYLHDILEDSDIVEADLRIIFGEEITNLVIELTSDESCYPPKTDPDYHLTKAKYLVEKMNSMSPKALSIKLVDRFHNVISAKETKKRWKIGYGKQTDYILEHIQPKNGFHEYMINKIRAELSS